MPHTDREMPSSLSAPIARVVVPLALQAAARAAQLADEAAPDGKRRVARGSREVRPRANHTH